jgi:FKBP-type peptidyl-prolyl cis-trans isomerase FkpA
MQKKTNHRDSARCFIDTLEPRALFSAGGGPALRADVVTPRTTTTIVAAPRAAKIGQSVTISVHVSASRSLGAVTGTVEFLNNGNLIGVSGTPLILTLNAKDRASYTFGPGNIAFYDGMQRIEAEFISGNSLPDSTSRPALLNIIPPKTSTNAQGLAIATVRPGHGKGIEDGQTATVLYTGFLQSTGAVYTYSAATAPGTFSYTVGAGEILPGIDDGTLGMKIGETRLMIIPPSLAYGNKAEPPSIPANAELVFIIKLVSIS